MAGDLVTGDIDVFPAIGWGAGNNPPTNLRE
jgi:hypothetical protein